jgi:hypothetical protein
MSSGVQEFRSSGVQEFRSSGASQRAEADLAVAEKAETGANGGVRSLVVPYRARRMP